MSDDNDYTRHNGHHYKLKGIKTLTKDNPVNNFFINIPPINFES